MKGSILVVLLSLLAGQAYANKSLAEYKPVLESTLKRTVAVEYAKGYAIEKVKKNIYVITDGIWQSAAIVTKEGVVLIDAPESFGMNIEKAVKEVTSKPIVSLVYTHGHSDHVGGSQYLKNIEGLEIIALESVANMLREQNDPRRLVPNKTFTGAYVINKGGKRIHLASHVSYHSNEGDIFVSVPEDKFLMVIDVLAPGYVPFKNLDLSNNIHGYLAVFDHILAYDFDVFIAGHLGVIGNRNDVIQSKAYVDDLYATVKRVHASTDMMAVMAGAAETIGWDNKYLLFKVFLDKVIDDSASEMEARWSDKLGGVDVWSKSHASTMLNYIRWDD